MFNLICSSISGLVSTCNENCGCTTAAFEPICDLNHTVYFSPCHAGCANVTTIAGVKVLQNKIVTSYLQQSSSRLLILQIEFFFFCLFTICHSYLQNKVSICMYFSHTSIVPAFQRLPIAPRLTPSMAAAQKTARCFTCSVCYYSASCFSPS